MVQDINVVNIRSEICKRSFFYFFKEFISIIEPNEMVYNWHIEYLCNEAEIVARWVIDKKPKEYDLIINIAPGTTKSTIFSRLLPVWIWILDDTRKIATSTISDDTTKEFSTTSRDLIQSEKFKLFFPHVKIRQDKNEKHFYETENGGRRFAFSTFGKKIGKHNDLIIEDDPHTYDELISEVKMKSVIRQNQNLLTRVTERDKTPYIMVMQRLGIEDLTNHYLELKEKGVKIKQIVLPAELSENIQPIELKENYINGLFDSKRLSYEILEKTKLLLGYRYDAEFMQNPLPNVDGLMFTDLNKLDFDVQEIIQNCEISISNADFKDEGKDSYAVIFSAFYKNRIYVLDVIYNFKGNSENENRFIEFTKLYKIHRTFIEKNNQQSYIKTIIKPAIDGFTNVVPIWTKDNKIELMKSKSHYSRFVVFRKNHINKEYNNAFEHLSKFPRDGKAKDDGIEDVFSKMLKFYTINSEYLNKLFL